MLQWSSSEGNNAFFSAMKTRALNCAKKVQNAVTGYNPEPEMPLEVRLAIDAWANARAHVFSQIDSYSADHREIQLEAICTEITEMMTRLEDMFLRTT